MEQNKNFLHGKFEKKMEENRANFHPIISSIQKIALYETKSKFYLVGSNNTQTRFRVLKIDRFAPKDLLINDDKTEYTPDEIHSLVNMIDSGNQQQSQSQQQQQQQQRGISKIISAFGIVGFIRFLEGYYIILITKRRKIAIIGYHTIYKIEDTSMIYIPHDSVRIVHPDEQRYVKMFQNIDLASNFYFSYSYDITHTLQYNLVNPKLFIPRRDDSNIDNNDDNTSATTDLSDMIKNSSDYGIRTSPNEKFVWNLYLLRILEENDIHPDWLLYIIHGFIGQSKINIFGRSILITLIARRSSKYAGTRFLKRGANQHGDVANEVETEQIVNDATKSSLHLNNFTSFVQLRGSIPGNWRQDMGKMVGKPTIIIDLLDPYCEISSKHFNDILKRYGTPIIILNLVKQKERNNKKQESLLSNEFYKTIKYLNQFLSPSNQIIYKQFDMASKLKLNINIMENLNLLTKNCIKKIGIFHNINNKQQQQQLFKQQLYDNRYNLQCGIIRTNCVDCLDRTNTAQFAIGKCVLGYQLYILGVLDKLDIDFDTDCIRMLESLYEDHGDTLALQYGGSQLVHRIKTYRKTSPWTSQGNDIMQTLSRYYSNTFSDAEKQNAINLFLGVFVPNESEPQIWEYTSDYYFHHKLNPSNNNNNKSLTQWWDSEIIKYLPYSLNDVKKSCYEIIQIHNRYDTEMIDGFIDYYRPYEITILNDLYFFNITNSIRDFMPNFTTDYSPFILRIRPIRRREENYNYKKNQQSYNCNKNPSVTGQSSTSSATSSASSCDEPGDDEIVDELSNQQLQQNNEDAQKPITFKSLFPTMLQVYGTELKSPNRNDIFLYKNYVLIGKKANGTTKQLITPTISSTLSLKAKSQFLNSDSTVSVQPPKIDQNSIEIYKNYVKSGRDGYVETKSNDLILYGNYANFDLKKISARYTFLSTPTDGAL